MRYFILLFCFIFFRCETVTVAPPTSFELGKPYTLTLRFGQTQTIKSLDLQVGFRDILQDSRCPTGAYCVWAGKGDISLRLFRPNSGTAFVQASISGNADKNSNSGHFFTDTLGVRVKLLQLDPHPRTDTLYQKSDYVALLEISSVVFK